MKPNLAKGTRQISYWTTGSSTLDGLEGAREGEGRNKNHI